MKIQLIICSIIFVLFGGSIVLAQNRSFVQEDIIRIPGVTSEATVHTLSVQQRSTSKVYMDGFNRPMQNVTVAASPSQKDLVQPIVYDALGRRTITYLPYVSTTGNGALRANAINEQSLFYQTGNQKIATDTEPYIQSLIEDSPLQRPYQMGSVGSGYQPGQHYRTQVYRTNTTSENIHHWKGDGSYAGTYAAGNLSVVETTDEQGGKTVVYTDKSGKTVFKREWLDAVGGIAANTAYIFSIGGQLRFVVTPKAYSLMVSGSNFDLSQASLNGLLFEYVYDERGREVERQTPGGGRTFIVYDPLDRPILSQDAKLRSTNKWNYIKYDSRGRSISQGTYTNPVYTSRLAMQTYVNGLNFNSNFYESRSSNSATGYYSNVAFPTSDIDPLSYQYFDNYDLDQNGSADYAYQSQGLSGENSASAETDGLPTISRSRSVGSGLSNIWLSSVVFYDKYSRPIQTLSNNQLTSSMSSTTTVVLDFEGKRLRSKTQQVAGSNTTTIGNEFNYDHRSRPTSIDQTHNGGSSFRVAAYEYNELGQLVDKKLHSTNSGASFLQSLDFRYTIRGQLSSINNSTLSVDSRNDDSNDVFGIEFLYHETESELGNTSYYNGLLSAVKWKVSAPTVATGNERRYVFSYDKMMRLTDALYADRNGSGAWGNATAFDEKNISYDLNGNILSLQRNAILSGSLTVADNLTYSYQGNRLSNLSDAGTSTFGFKNLTGSSAAYAYDADGNLINDPKKGLNLIYNEIGRTERITITTSSGRYIDYTYDAGGSLLRKQAFDGGSLVKTTDYIAGFVYENGNLMYFGMAEGRVRKASGSLIAEYMVKDHLGNIRLSFEDDGGVPKVRQENSYYPFGLTLPGNSLPTDANKELYNAGSEWQNDFADLPDLQQTFYRMYDAAIGRFTTVDPAAEASESFSVYHYALNNPVMFNDPLGDVAEGPYADFWNQALSYTTQNGAHYSASGGWTAYDTAAEGFYAGAQRANELGQWGLYKTWADTYEEAAARYNAMTGIEGARVVTNSAGGYVQTVVYRQNAGKINDNGIDGIGLIFKVGSGPAKVANQGDGWIDKFQTTLDVAGIADPTGAADLLNAAIYAGRGQWGNAGISALGILPYIGDIGKAGRLAKKAHTVYQGIDRTTGVVKYVGITSREVSIRAAEHMAKGGAWKNIDYIAVPGAQGLNRLEARIMEQNLINQYGLGNLMNSINSISPAKWGMYGIK